MSNNLSTLKKKQIFHLLCEGNGIRSIERLVGCSVNTISKLQRDLYGKIVEFNEHLLKDIHCPIIEADELQTYIAKKGRNNNETGSHWVYVGLDRASRLIIDFHVGKRDTNDARIFLKLLSNRLDLQSEINTDSLIAYMSAIGDTPVGFSWDNKNRIELMRARCLKDNDKLGRSCTNRIETHNGQLRQHVSRLSRKTRCFSKKKDRLIEHLTLFFFYYNFIKKHRALKTCPAVRAGIIKSPMNINQLVS